MLLEKKHLQERGIERIEKLAKDINN
jgi:hypothetical protein